MDAELKKLKKLVKFMQKEGVLSVKLPQIELSLAPAAIFHDPKAPEPEAPTPQEDPLSLYSPEAIAMWSAPGYADDEAAVTHA